MTLEEMRKLYGDEYPEAVACNGHRLPLSHETRFMRHYSGPKMSTFVSRFSDGSAHITLEELSSAWNGWDAFERYDLARSLMWLEAHEELPDILSFLLSHGNESEWSAIAQMVARCLPQDEAFNRLVTLLAKLSPASSANIIQALALTKHPRVEEVLRNQLARLWAEQTLLDDHPFCNDAASTAAWTLGELLGLGLDPHEMETEVRTLAGHPNAFSRLHLLMATGPYYPWLAREPASRTAALLVPHPQDVATFNMGGVPASFATAGEKPWKQALATNLLQDQPQEARGLRVHFRVASIPPRWPHGQDLDNLCEPVLSVLVNKAGWFRGRRSNIRWFEASKSVEPFSGCNLAVSRDSTPVWRTPDGQPLLDAIYPGPLPRSAQDPAMAAWALGHLLKKNTGPCLVRLSFASSRVNLGDVATGPVKSAIDCLYPVLGGQPGRPADDLVTILQVEKGLEHAGTVRVTISSLETS